MSRPTDEQTTRKEDQSTQTVYVLNLTTHQFDTICAPAPISLTEIANNISMKLTVEYPQQQQQNSQK